MNGVKEMSDIYSIRFSKTDCSPQNSKELFNLRHSSLRNAIERIFGVLKKRFHVLTEQLEYSFAVQVQLVKGICCLHNIIRLVGGDDLFDEEWVDTVSKNSSSGNSGDKTVTRKIITVVEANHAKALRNKIARQMWTQYSRYKT